MKRSAESLRLTSGTTVSIEVSPMERPVEVADCELYLVFKRGDEEVKVLSDFAFSTRFLFPDERKSMTNEFGLDWTSFGAWLSNRAVFTLRERYSDVACEVEFPSLTQKVWLLTAKRSDLSRFVNRKD